VEANPSATAIAHTGHLNAHRTNASVHLTLRKVAIPDYRVVALGTTAVGILGKKHRDFGLNRLRQYSLRSLA
jgi:hypothetical protein